MLFGTFIFVYVLYFRSIMNARMRRLICTCKRDIRDRIRPVFLSMYLVLYTGEAASPLLICNLQYAIVIYTAS